MTVNAGWCRALLFARLFSPQGLVTRAIFIVAAFLVMHACGLRQYTTIVTGTSPTGGAVDGTAVMLAMLYVAGHLGAVAAAPVMTLAGLGWTAWLYWRQGVGNQPPPT